MKKFLVLLILLSVASAQPLPEASLEGEVVEDLLSTADETLNGIEGTVDEVAPSEGPLAFFSKAFAAFADFAVGSLIALSTAGLALSLTLAKGVAISTDGLLHGFGAVGQLLSLSLTGLTGSIAAIATGLTSGLLAYVGFVESMRPEQMQPAAFTAVAATGTVATLGASGWAGWDALRRWGLMAPAVAGFSRIGSDELLNHPMRNHIYQVIQENPGIHASQLARDVGAGWGTVVHHLDKLQKGEMVTTRKVNNQNCYFQNGGNVARGDMEIMSAVKSDSAQLISAFVLSHPMTSQKQLAEALGISPALASFHIKKLSNLGVLEKIRSGKETLLATTEGLRRVLEADRHPAAAALNRRAQDLQFSS